MTVNCPHCGRALEQSPELAGQTVACPFCAEDLMMPAPVAPPTPQTVEYRAPAGRRKKSSTPVWVYIAASFSVLIVAALILGNSETKTGPQTGDKTGAYLIAQEFVTDQLKAPATAKYPSSATSVRLVGKKWHVRGYVDSQNSFGALIRSEWHCVVYTTDGTNWSLDEIVIE